MCQLVHSSEPDGFEASKSFIHSTTIISYWGRPVLSSGRGIYSKEGFHPHLVGGIIENICTIPIPAIPPYHVRTLHIRGAWTTADPNQCEEIYLDTVITSRGRGGLSGSKLKIQEEVERDNIGEDGL